ncbi:MAG: hypothetical protein ACYTFY_18890 [Planctomycetota bacterium]|jgi:hypothetical protein
MADNNQLTNEERLELSIEEFMQSLTPEEEMLIRIRDELYEASWDNMKRDLENRLQGRAFIFKLVSRIEHDLQAVELLEKFEKLNDIDLGSINRE